MSNNIRVIYPLWVFLLISGAGCELAPSPIKVTVNFSDAQGIQSSDPVEFNGVNIGAVNTIEPATPGAIVQLQLDPAKTSALQSNAMAKIATDGGKRRVEISNPPEPGSPIADGAILRELKPKTGLAAIGDVLTDMSETVAQAASQAKGHVDRTKKEWDDAKTNINDLLKNLSGKSEIITKEFQTEVESLFKIMEAQPRGVEAKPDQQLAQVEEKYQALESNCAQKQKDLSDQGKKDAAADVQKLCEQVKTAVDLYKQEGAG